MRIGELARKELASWLVLPDFGRLNMQLAKRKIQKFQRTRKLSQMQKMDPIEFEHFVGWLYQQQGYTVETTVASGDEGIDLEMSRWGKKTIVQCKRYKGTVGQPVVRDLYGTMFHAGARAASIVTTGKFSRQAESWAAGKPIVLIDGNDLVALINKIHRENKTAKGAALRSLTTTQIWLLLGLLLLILAGAWWWFP